MIEIETDVFDVLHTALTSKFGEIYITNDEDEIIPPQSPCVGIVEADNTTDQSTLDSSGKENFANLMYEVNVYSNKATGRKAEANAIFSVIDDKMLGLGFVRMTKMPMSSGSSYYRIISRYAARVSKNKHIYRR